MEKSIIALLVTIVIGVVVDMIGSPINMQLGGIAAVAVMGAFIIYFNEKK